MNLDFIYVQFWALLVVAYMLVVCGLITCFVVLNARRVRKLRRKLRKRRML